MAFCSETIYATLGVSNPWSGQCIRFCQCLNKLSRCTWASRWTLNHSGQSLSRFLHHRVIRGMSLEWQVFESPVSELVVRVGGLKLVHNWSFDVRNADELKRTKVRSSRYCNKSWGCLKLVAEPSIGCSECCRFMIHNSVTFFLILILDLVVNQRFFDSVNDNYSPSMIWFMYNLILRQQDFFHKQSHVDELIASSSTGWLYIVCPKDCQSVRFRSAVCCNFC